MHSGYVHQWGVTGIFDRVFPTRCRDSALKRMVPAKLSAVRKNCFNIQTVAVCDEPRVASKIKVQKEKISQPQF